MAMAINKKLFCDFPYVSRKNLEVNFIRFRYDPGQRFFLKDGSGLRIGLGSFLTSDPDLVFLEGWIMIWIEVKPSRIRNPGLGRVLDIWQPPTSIVRT